VAAAEAAVQRIYAETCETLRTAAGALAASGDAEAVAGLRAWAAVRILLTPLVDLSVSLSLTHSLCLPCASTTGKTLLWAVIRFHHDIVR